MGKITTVIDDNVEDRLRAFIWRKFKGRGRHIGEIIEEALTEYLDRHEDEVV